MRIQVILQTEPPTIPYVLKPGCMLQQQNNEYLNITVPLFTDQPVWVKAYTQADVMFHSKDCDGDYKTASMVLRQSYPDGSCDEADAIDIPIQEAIKLCFLPR